MAIQNAAAVLVGASHLTALTEKDEQLAAHLVGSGLFYVDPTKVTLVPFFKASSLQAYKSQATRSTAQVPGNTASKMQLPVATKPPKTQTGGIPNKG